jgi:hypothetical protein
VKPGLYSLKAENGSTGTGIGGLLGKRMSTASPPSYFLAVDSEQYADLAKAYTALDEMPLFSTLSETERSRARVLVLQSLSDTVKKPN